MFKSFNISKFLVSPFALVLLAVVINLWTLYPETTAKTELNDNVFAFSLVYQTDQVWQKSGCPFSLFNCISSLSDFWVSTWALGFPLPHYYQHLPHLVPVILFRFLSILIPSITLFTTFEWFKYLLLASLPFSVYWAARKLEIPPLAAGFAALLSPLISTQYLYGTDFNAVLWRGSGMYTQLWGFITAPLALGSLYDTIVYRRSLVRSALLLALTFSGHLIFGYIVALSSPIVVLSILFGINLPRIGNLGYLGTFGYLLKSLFRPLLPFAFTLTLTFLFLAYWAIPLLLDSSWHNSHSLWDDRSKFDSYGMLEVTKKLLNGDIFDANRLPVMTSLLFIGFFVALIHFWSSHNPNKSNQSNETNVSNSSSSLQPLTSKTPISYLFLPLMFIQWYFLYWGRSTWGQFIDLLPMSDGIHLHRFVNGLHLSGIFLIGIGLAFLASQLLKFHKILNLPKSVSPSFVSAAITIAIILALLSPIYKERLDYLAQNTNLINQANEIFQKDYPDFAKTVDYLKANRPGRIWVGRPGNWGNDFNVGHTHAFMQFSMAGIDVSGFLPETWSPNSDVEQFFDEKRFDHYQAFGLKTIVAPPDREVPPQAKKIAQFGKFVIYDLPQVSEFEVATTPFKLFSSKKNDLSILRQWLESDWPSYQAHPFVLLDREPLKLKTLAIDSIKMKDLSNFTYEKIDNTQKLESNLFAQNPFQFPAPATPSGRILSQSRDLNHYQATVSVPQTKTNSPFLVLKASFHPYWTATVDNRPTEVFPVAPVFAAVPLPGCPDTQCQYKVDFTYQPSALKKTLLTISLSTLILSVIFRKRLEKLY